MRTWFWLLVFWILSVLSLWIGLTFYLNINWLDILPIEIMDVLEELRPWIIWFALISIIPGLFFTTGLHLYLHHRRGLPNGLPKFWQIVILLGLLVGFFGGIRPAWKELQLIALFNEHQKAEQTLTTNFETLCKDGKEVEAIALIERTLKLHEKTIAHSGLHSRSYNHGFSYLFVTLHPASSDLSRRLGFGPSAILFDKWYDGGDHSKDPLLPFLRDSNNPLVRGIGHWMSKDYETFENDMLDCARNGDERIDSLALIAAINSKNRQQALISVEPILNRGIGLGQQVKGGPYHIPATQIRDVLKGHVAPQTLPAYFTTPP